MIMLYNKYGGRIGALPKPKQEATKEWLKKHPVTKEEKEKNILEGRPPMCKKYVNNMYILKGGK